MKISAYATVRHNVAFNSKLKSKCSTSNIKEFKKANAFFVYILMAIISPSFTELFINLYKSGLDKNYNKFSFRGGVVCKPQKPFRVLLAKFF